MPSSTVTEKVRQLPVGAEVQPEGGVHFRVWAPKKKRIEVVVEGGNGSPSLELKHEANGYFSGFSPSAREGTRYRYRIDGAELLVPDPASRYQPEGPHGPSEVVDPGRFRWTDQAWKGASIEGQVIYEMHIGTYTPEGTFAAAEQELEELARLGITAVELMPVAEFSGPFGWGYDGVDLFAPYHRYGRPDDLRRFVDRAHALGMAVLLDVVYNHLGPDGNYLKEFSETYFSTTHSTDWGEAINYDGPECGPVREFFRENAAYWAREYHFDGLRLDATQDIYDDSDRHILREITEAVREAAGSRKTLLIAENEPQHTRLVRPAERGGYGMDGLWNDDFHHSAIVAMTGQNEAYYTDYLGTPQELVSSIKYGYLYQGQWYKWQGKRRGTPAFDLSPAVFVNYLENHDQVANLGLGVRLYERTSPGRYRAMTALLLLAPGTPLLFQGQEFASSRRFTYFADPAEALREVITKGRAEFVGQFRSAATPEVQALYAIPSDPKTFELCKLDLSEREKHAPVYELHRDLLRLRREDPAFRMQRKGAIDGAVLGDEAFVLRYFMEDGRDRLLIVNLGRDLHLHPSPEPLLGPPEGTRWEILWSSEHPKYGGGGTAPLDTEDDNWRIPGHAAVVLRGL